MCNANKNLIYILLETMSEIPQNSTLYFKNFPRAKAPDPQNPVSFAIGLDMR